MYIGADLLNLFFQGQDVLFVAQFDSVIVILHLTDLLLQIIAALFLFVNVTL